MLGNVYPLCAFPEGLSENFSRLYVLHTLRSIINPRTPHEHLQKNNIQNLEKTIAMFNSASTRFCVLLV